MFCLSVRQVRSHRLLISRLGDLESKCYFDDSQASELIKLAFAFLSSCKTYCSRRYCIIISTIITNLIINHKVNYSSLLRSCSDISIFHFLSLDFFLTSFCTDDFYLLLCSSIRSQEFISVMKKFACVSFAFTMTQPS